MEARDRNGPNEGSRKTFGRNVLRKMKVTSWRHIASSKEDCWTVVKMAKVVKRPHNGRVSKQVTS
jgi:hypothetical protein